MLSADRFRLPHGRCARRHALSTVLALSIAALPSASHAQAAPRALMRFPTLHGETVVFASGGDLWRVGLGGGLARRLTTDAGMDLMPRFSPDGREIAFTGDYDGNTDVYVIPAEGGPARRLTFHSDVVEHAPTRWGPDNMVVGWTPDGKDVLFLSRRTTFNSWFGQLFLVSREGGLPRQFPVPRGGTTSFSPDGTKIAYNRIFRNFRTWKDYYGGLAQDVWIYDLGTHALERVTDWKGTDTYPMWYRDTVYFASDRGAEKRLNIWAYDRGTRAFRQVTHFEDYDVDWPSLGDTGIVFQCGGALYAIDLPSETLHEIDVTVPSDAARTRPRWVDATKQIQSYDVAPNGKRAVFGARGEVFTVPVEHGDTRDLTRTSGAREREPSWSPDGTWVAYVTDRTGETQIALRHADGTGDEQVLTDRKHGHLYGPVWSPDSEKLAFSDGDHTVWILTVKDRKVVEVDRDPRAEIRQMAWSPDARWLAYAKAGENDLRDLYLYSLVSGEAARLSGGDNDDFDPVFGAEGKYLFFISSRHEKPTPSESEFNVATIKTNGVYVATLRADEASPFAPRSDEGTPAKEGTADAQKKEEPWKPGAISAVRIDVEGLMRRVVPLPIEAGDIRGLATARKRLFYVTLPVQGFEEPLPGEEAALHAFDMTERKDEVLVSPLDGYALSADGTSLLIKNEDAYQIVPTRKVEEEEEKGHDLDLSHMRARIDPRAEWTQMFHEAWRLERDLFFNPEMNGVDWPAMRTRYERLLPELTCREDLNYLIGEMLGELHNSHTYVGGGDEPGNEPVPTGLLGVDFGLDPASGRYFFETIYPGDNSREAYRSPLTEPGVNVKEGDFLLAVEGDDLRAPANPYASFVNTLGRTVSLTVANDAAGKDRRDVVVRPVPHELDLREKAWIDHNRAAVDDASSGKIGYLYLSDMSEKGMEQFVRQFYAQIRKEGLIVDVRWNGGGFIDQMLLERLRRIPVGMETNRERVPFPIPPQVLHGDMACLINHYSASDGDIFPYYFRKYGLGPLIGTRTWGGVRGIRGYWSLTDGGYVTIPEGSIYGLDSEWVIENHGVEPDVEVDDLPGDVMEGEDAQLHAAIRMLLEKIESHPKTLPEPPPPLPAYPPQGR
jgi:tricorn protease